MSSDVVRCSLCDNQMPANSEVCFVCGTPNPFYAIYAGQESVNDTSANGADLAGEPSTIAPSQSSSARSYADGEFDFSALFAQTEAQVEETTTASPEPASGLDLSSLFSWGDDAVSTPVVEEAPAEETLSAEAIETGDIAPVELEAEPAAVEQPQLDATSEGDPSFDIAATAVDLPPVEVETEPPTLDATTELESEEIEVEAELEAGTAPTEDAPSELDAVGFSEQPEVVAAPGAEEASVAAEVEAPATLETEEAEGPLIFKETEVESPPVEEPVTDAPFVAEAEALSPEAQPAKDETTEITEAVEAEGTTALDSVATEEAVAYSDEIGDTSSDVDTAHYLAQGVVAETDAVSDVVAQVGEERADDEAAPASSEMAYVEEEAHLTDEAEVVEPGVDASDIASLSTDDLVDSQEEPAPVQAEANPDSNFVDVHEAVTSDNQSDQPEEVVAPSDTSTPEGEPLAIAYSTENDVAPAEAVEVAPTHQDEVALSEHDAADLVPGMAASVKGEVEAETPEAVPALPVPDILASEEVGLDEAPAVESPPLFSYHEAEDEDVTAQPSELTEPSVTMEQAEAHIEQTESLEAVQSIEAIESEEEIEPVEQEHIEDAVEITTEASPAPIEPAAEQIEAKAENLDTGPGMPDAIEVEASPAELLEGQSQEAVIGDSLTSPQPEPVPEPEPVSSYDLEAQRVPPQHLEPQIWAPPPPPPPPTPYGTLSIRADEDVWPSYVPPTSADTGSLPASDIDITPAAPVATTGVAPVDTPVLPSQPSGVEQPYSAPNQEYIPIHEAPVQPVTEDTQAQPLAAEPIVEVSPSAPIEEQVAQSTQYADGPLDLSALFDQMQIDTSARPIPRPIVTAPEPPVEVQPEPAGPSIAPAQAEPAPPPSRPQTVMPITITPTSSTQPNLGNSYQGSAVSPYDAAAWQAFSGMGGAGGKATAPQEETSSQEQATWQQFAQSGAPDPYATGVGPADQANAEAWQPAPGMPRPQRGTPEYDAMVRAALAQRGIPYNPSTPAPQAQPQQPQAQPSWQPQPGQPRPKPGTPEYEEMARAALAQRGIGTGPLPSSPASSSQPYQSSPQQPQAQPAWQPQPGQPRPKPGTPEYEEMVRQALAQRGISTGPLPSQSPSQNQGPPASPYDSSQPRPKPGTPEYEEMVRQALNERRQREGR